LLSTSPSAALFKGWSGLKAEEMNLVLDDTAAGLSAETAAEFEASCSLENYLSMPDHSMDARIAAAREKLGATTILLGHHYQRDEVIRFADFTGDSYKLSNCRGDRRPLHRVLRRSFHG
jgi:quinolinate synthase